MLEAQMAQATAAGNFEQCISLRQQIKVAKRQEIEGQIAQASAQGQFELCISLRTQLNAII
jgi:excinuclease UvrABC nuclease subunit